LGASTSNKAPCAKKKKKRRGAAVALDLYLRVPRYGGGEKEKTERRYPSSGLRELDHIDAVKRKRKRED